jgi:hypothetical protein
MIICNFAIFYSRSAEEDIKTIEKEIAVIVADEEKEVEEKKVRVEELIVSGFGG